jgi:mono/diheme cytochrome c family protein
VLKWIIRLAVLGVVLFALIQAIPYGRNHKNPTTSREIRWNAPATRSLAKIGCYDCHSDETTWPWYSNVAPASWLVYRDVKEGRSRLNFSEWDKPQDVEIGELVEVVRGGGMPPWQYKILHGKSRLSKAQREQLAAGIEKTIATDPPIAGSGGGG